MINTYPNYRVHFTIKFTAMKRVNYSIILICTVIIMNIGCTKTETSDSNGAKIRIKETANNQAMDNSVIYEYNSKGLLIGISQEGKYDTIEYNANGLPIKVSSQYYGAVLANIEWNNTGFVVTDENFRSVCTLNSDNLPTSNTFFSNGEAEYIETFVWIGSDSLKVIRTYYPPASDINEDSEENYKFGTGISPFKGINIALFFIDGMPPMGDLEEFPNKGSKCTSEYTSINWNAKFTYEYNKQNYPVKVNAIYSTIEGIDNSSIFLEYESY